MNGIPLTISCRACQQAGALGRGGDFSCEACCVRHIRQLIKTMGVYGGNAHEERIKDLLVEELVKELNDEQN